MEENNPLNQQPSSKIKELEQELDQLHQKATQDYKDAKTHKFYKGPDQPTFTPPVNTEGSAGAQPPQQTKPTYLEEKQLAGMSAPIKPQEKAGGKAKLIFKISLVLLLLALLVAGVFYLIGAMSGQ